MSHPFDLGGKVALVTGGGTGIGRAIAECLHKAGATVVITGRRHDVLIDTAKHLRERARAASTDITNPTALYELIDGIEDEEGRLDILVNNAGLHLKRPAAEMTPEDLRKVLEVHLVAAMEASRHAGRGMRQRGAGSIVFVGSMTARIGMPLVAAYTAAKAGVVALTRQLAVEWAGDGIRVNSVTPGWIETPMTAVAFEGDPDRASRALQRTPMGRMGRPHDIGWAVVYLSSEEARFVTGADLVVDGGASIGF